MNGIFENWNVIQILGVGLSGLALLLMILAYRLLNTIVTNPNPTPGAVTLVKFYLGLTVSVLVIVGFFSIPLLSKNKNLVEQKAALNDSVVKLNNDTKNLQAEKTVLTSTNEVTMRLDTIKQATSNGEIKNQLHKIKQITDKLPATVSTTTDPVLKKQVIDFKRNVDVALKATKNISGKDSLMLFKKSKNEVLVLEHMNDRLFDTAKK